MSTTSEIQRALEVFATAGGRELAILHCVSAYPTPRDAENLRAIRTLLETFRLPTGLSDHGSGLLSAVAAVALGACMYERHLALDGDHTAIDRAVSSTPAEMRAIVHAVEETRLALGSGRKVCQTVEAVNVAASRRGLYASRALRPGDTITAREVVALRPETALPPSRAAELIGATVARPIAAGEPFHPADLPAAVGETGAAAAGRPR